MTNYDRRPLSPQDVWLLDSTGRIVGVELAQARRPKTYIAGSATDGALVADVTGNLTGNVTGNLNGSVQSSSSISDFCNAGNAATGVIANEFGDGQHHLTVLTLNTVLPAIAGGAALGIGKLIYTLPAGAQVINSSQVNVAITQTQAHITADTPTVGLGTVIASGVVAVLSGTATFQNINVGKVAADCNGTATVQTAKTTASPFSLVTDVGGVKAIYFNAAATWAASGDAAALLTGTVVLDWVTLA